MLKDQLPCADPKCKDKMRLIFKNDRYIGYRCLLKPNSHNFRYNIEQKRWEKIIITTKPVIGYKKTPHDVLFGEELFIESI
ncbi:MAG: hypothetical protein CW691_02450 [Candidatus Bathyarchaeum sp.]|nr:MAG: hypothetical protein CW691_02450 [Candidatus Bathyarchaeum sp.]